MNLCIRTDSSFELGSGHVMRCLVLADLLRSRGAQVHFISRDHAGNLSSLVLERGFQVLRLPDSGGGLMTQERDAEETAGMIRGIGQGLDWLVCDHYSFGPTWEDRLRGCAKHLMVIEDQMKQRHSCDLLFNQDCLSREMEDRQKRLVPRDCKTFLGPRYALLRPEFLKLKGRIRPRSGEVRRILVCMGGMDHLNETLKVLDALGKIAQPQLFFDIVIGASNPHQGEIRQKISTLQNARLYEQAGNMAELMSRSDLAVGAGGTMIWERCSAGLPSVVVSVAENQTEMTDYLGKEGFLMNLGDAKDVTSGDYCAALRMLMDDPARRESQSQKCLALRLGEGLNELAAYLEKGTPKFNEL